MVKGSIRGDLCREREARQKAEADYKDTLALLERRNGEVGKAEAENQKLRELLNRAIEIAEDFLSNGHDTACYYEVNKYRCRCGFIDTSDELDKIKAKARLATEPEEQCDHAEHAEPLTGSYRCRKCDKVFDIMEPIGNEWDFVNVGDKMQSGDEALLGSWGGWTPVEKLNWVGEILSNPHTWVRRKHIQ
jgi:hypothetical protein